MKVFRLFSHHVDSFFGGDYILKLVDWALEP